MVNFYHDLGIIMVHRDTVILSTQWLINLFRQLITIPDSDKMVRNTFKRVFKLTVVSNGPHFGRHRRSQTVPCLKYL